MIGLRYLPNVTTLEHYAEKCIGCSMCQQVCPHGVYATNGRRTIVKDRDACMECGACARNCPEGAISVRAGVGCAYAIIMGSLKGTEPTCDCGGSPSGGGVETTTCGGSGSPSCCG
jgi:NAD-dependent dihydropyrimidine dehydrogenase PreA subunit